MGANHFQLDVFKFLLIGILFLTSCNLPLVEPEKLMERNWEDLKGTILVLPQDTCVNQTLPPPPPLGFELKSEEKRYSLIGSNPYKKGEILYLVTHYSFPIQYEIWWKDLFTGEKALVARKSPWGVKADWQENGWVTLTLEGQIWKFKGRGDSLQQLTFDVQNYNPSWSQGGDSIYFILDSTSFRGSKKLAIMDAEGRLLRRYDSLPHTVSIHSSPDKSKAVLYNNPGTGELSYIAKLHTLESSIIKYPDTSSIVGWAADNHRLRLTSGRTLQYYDWETGEVEILAKTNCSQHSYRYFTVYEEGNYILADKYISNFIPPYTILVNTKVVFIDMSKDTEWEIVLDN